MGHVVVGAPRIEHIHLHGRLLRALRQRGHRASVLCTEHAARTFWLANDSGVATLPPSGPALPALPLADLAPGAGTARRERLQALAARIHAWFDAQRPDLVLLHGDRGPHARLLQFAAQSAGARVLWTGDGLLPHTLQVDPRGLDGDASCAQRPAADFRVVRGDRALLSACLAAALARTTPFALPRAPVRVPALRRRLCDVLPAWRADGVAAAWQSVRAWRRALPPRGAVVRPHGPELPRAPFVAVLLQRRDDPRVRFDGGGEVPDAAELVDAAARAARELGSDVGVVAVAAGDARGRTLRGVPLLPGPAALDAAVTALAVVTCNHPLASAALLAGTPVLHTGRALYGVRGVATRTDVHTLGDALRHALAHDHPTLRERFLTWVFGHGHVWCSPTDPDHNGVLGLVQAIEARLAEPAGQRPALRYRAGPTWPLAAERPRD